MTNRDMGGADEARQASNSVPVPYQFEGHNFSIVDHDGEVWFVASDASRELAYHNTNDLTRTLDEDEKGTHIVRTLGGDQVVSIISEPGLYRAIIQRRANKKHDVKLLAKISRFQRFVFHDILPSIRKTGAYTAVGVHVPRSDAAVADYLRLLVEKLTAVESRVADLQTARAVPTFDYTGSVTSDQIIELSGIPRSQRVRGTASVVTHAMLDFCGGLGCFRTAADLNRARPWRFPATQAHEWLFGESLGVERIRAQIARRQRQGTKSGQGSLHLVAPVVPAP